jgi:hypothetical protein
LTLIAAVLSRDPHPDLEDERDQRAESAPCADVEPFGVVSGDVLHGLSAEAGRGLPIDDGDVGPEQGVPDVVAFGAGGGVGADDQAEVAEVDRDVGVVACGDRGVRLGFQTACERGE